MRLRRRAGCRSSSLLSGTRAPAPSGRNSYCRRRRQHLVRVVTRRVARLCVGEHYSVGVDLDDGCCRSRRQGSHREELVVEGQAGACHRSRDRGREVLDIQSEFTRIVLHQQSRDGRISQPLVTGDPLKQDQKAFEGRQRRGVGVFVHNAFEQSSHGRDTPQFPTLKNSHWTD